jgi:D-arabinose 1-dehydrogenase-like Zn-dependent alcohol dehydrogenase
MKAITVEPNKAGTARFGDVPEPDVRDGSVLVEAVAIRVCGTDIEIAEGKYGRAPPGKTRLVLGHKSLGRVIEPTTIVTNVLGIGNGHKPAFIRFLVVIALPLFRSPSRCFR